MEIEHYFLIYSKNRIEFLGKQLEDIVRFLSFGILSHSGRGSSLMQHFPARVPLASAVLASSPLVIFRVAMWQTKLILK